MRTCLSLVLSLLCSAIEGAEFRVSLDGWARSSQTLTLRENRTSGRFGTVGFESPVAVTSVVNWKDTTNDAAEVEFNQFQLQLAGFKRFDEVNLGIPGDEFNNNTSRFSFEVEVLPSTISVRSSTRLALTKADEKEFNTTGLLGKDFVASPIAGSYRITAGDEVVSGTFEVTPTIVTDNPNRCCSEEALFDKAYTDTGEVLLDTRDRFDYVLLKFGEDQRIYTGILEQTAVVLEIDPMSIRMPGLHFLSAPIGVGPIAGDSNLDGVFNSQDLVQVFQVGLYETNGLADWAAGDWNRDSAFNSADLVVAFQTGKYEEPNDSPASVPEPSAPLALLASLAASYLQKERRRKTTQ